MIFHPPRLSTIGPGFQVGRVLPFRGGRGIGPFVFLDQMGPHEFEPGVPNDVPAHPHIGLSTLTYLFEGEIEHRDSLGVVCRIKPGEVNWMKAGRGVSHAEKTPAEKLHQRRRIHGLQAWVALPLENEDDEASFEHLDSHERPNGHLAGIQWSLIVGSWLGQSTKIKTQPDLSYVDCEVRERSEFVLPLDSDWEWAIYLVQGTLNCDIGKIEAPGLLELGRVPEFRARGEVTTRLIFFGGPPLNEKRSIWWNFVSSSKDRIETAKRNWMNRSFPQVPGEVDWVPHP